MGLGVDVLRAWGGGEEEVKGGKEGAGEVGAGVRHREWEKSGEGGGGGSRLNGKKFPV